MMAMPLRHSPLGDIIIGGVHQLRGTCGWLFWWSGVDPSASTTTIFGGVVQRGLNGGRMMVKHVHGGSVIWRHGGIIGKIDGVYMDLILGDCAVV
jgi:hypothetical protein